MPRAKGRHGNGEGVRISSERTQCLDALKRSTGSERVVVRRIAGESQLLREFRSKGSEYQHNHERVEEKTCKSRPGSTHTLSPRHF
jgi:hypothetical protein